MRLSKPILFGLIAVAIGALLAVRLLAESDWDPTVFAAFGEENAITDYAEEQLGREVVTRPKQGHDGKFFFVQSNDPWLLDPDSNAMVMDRPTYRSQRMFFPMVAALAGAFPATIVIWSLAIVNVLALGVGTWAISRIGILHGAPAWVGLGFGINLGLISELFVDGAGIVAFALAALGALALEEDRPGWAAAAFALSALTREVMLIFVAFIWLLWWIRRKERPWRLAIPAGLAVVAWALYLRFRLDAAVGEVEVRELTLVPFSGMIEALTNGKGTLVDTAVILLMLGLMLVVGYRALSSKVFLTWGAVGFAVLAPFLTVYVWQKSFDITRALAPLLTAFILEFAVSRSKTVGTRPVRSSYE